MRYQKMYKFILLFIAAELLTAVILDHPANILPGLVKIITMQDVLITDYVQIAGPGAALVNSALVTLVSTVILYLCKDPLNGFTIALIGLMSGFSLFGKNIVNIWPIILGTWTYARRRGEPFGQHVNVALMARQPPGGRPHGHGHRRCAALSVGLYLQGPERHEPL